MTKRNKLNNGENVNLGYDISSMKRISITENNEAQTVSFKRLLVAILEISYEPCAGKATKTKFEKVNYKKKEWYEPSKFEKSPH